ncbi:MAG: hypothetical protein EOP48_19870, partial [Sphingobacteriales bacterium]
MNEKKRSGKLWLPFLLVLLAACNRSGEPAGEMPALLASVAKTAFNSANNFAPGAAIRQLDSLLSVTANPEAVTGYLHR